MEDDNAYKCPSELEEFAKDNGYCGVFRASAKKDVNVKESMEFLIKDIIRRMEAMQQTGNEAFSIERKNVVLDTQKHTDTGPKRKQKQGCC